MAFEMLGISPAGFSMVPAEDAAQARGRARRRAARDGRAAPRPAAERHHHARRASRTRSPRSRRSGGSTNGVLHLLALAREAGVELVDRRLRPISERTPLLCDLKPGGRFVAPDLYARRRRAAPRSSDSTRRGCSTRTRRRSPARRSASSPTRRARRPARRSSGRSPTRSSRPAASRSCAATSRPRAASSSSPATSGALHTGPARVFEGEEDAMAAVTRGAIERRRRRRDPQRGPGRRPGHARDARRHRGDHRRRASARTSRCSPTGASPARRTASWPATSRPRRPAAGRSRRCATATRSRSTSTRRRLDVALADDEIAARVAAYAPPRAARPGAAPCRNTRSSSRAPRTARSRAERTAAGGAAAPCQNRRHARLLAEPRHARARRPARPRARPNGDRLGPLGAGRRARRPHRVRVPLPLLVPGRGRGHRERAGARAGRCWSPTTAGRLPADAAMIAKAIARGAPAPAAGALATARRVRPDPRPRDAADEARRRLRRTPRTSIACCSTRASSCSCFPRAEPAPQAAAGALPAAPVRRRPFIAAALRARVPIVPVAVLGAEEAMPVFARSAAAGG